MADTGRGCTPPQGRTKRWGDKAGHRLGALSILNVDKKGYCKWRNAEESR
jgi:hypothetical protein